MSQGAPPIDRATESGGSEPPASKGSLIAAPRVFLPAAGLLLAFVIATLAAPTKMNEWIGEANSAVVGNLGWWYIAIVTAFVFFALWLALSPMGNVVLAKSDDEEPEFALGSWFAMLFAAGMGIGLVFYGVSEPLAFFGDPPPGQTVPADRESLQGQAELAQGAMDRTFLHWGLHAWAIYVVVGLAIAYSVHRKGNPISIRWALEPVLGRWVKGFLGDVVDVIAVLGTLFGVATSLGLGVSQIAGGLQYLEFVDEPTDIVKVGLIIVITAIALVSVVTGVDKGIKYLSNFNMGLAVIFLVTILLVGPTVFVLSDYITNIGSYITNFFGLAFDAMPFQGEEGAAFQASWTTFYWGWWMSWAPFVGVFIARISKGRTVREFVLGVLLVPSLVTFLWFSVIGGSAIYHEIFNGGGLLTEDPESGTSAPNYDLALFQFLDTLPGPATVALSLIALFLIVVFFVTSSDSGSFVVDMLSSGGDQNPPVWSRAFWATMEGAVAAALLLAGGAAGEGLNALKTMAILLAAPFSIVMVVMAIATAKALMAEQKQMRKRQRKWLAEELAKEVER